MQFKCNTVPNHFKKFNTSANYNEDFRIRAEETRRTLMISESHPMVFRKLPKLTRRLPKITEECRRSSEFFRRFSESHPEDLQRLPNIVEDYPKTFEVFRKFPKIAEDGPKISNVIIRIIRRTFRKSSKDSL